MSRDGRQDLDGTGRIGFHHCGQDERVGDFLHLRFGDGNRSRSGEPGGTEIRSPIRVRIGGGAGAAATEAETISGLCSAVKNSQ